MKMTPEQLHASMREKAELISKLEACCESEGELVRSIAASTNVYIWVTHLGEYIQISPKELRRASKDLRSEVAGQWLAEEFGANDGYPQDRTHGPMPDHIANAKNKKDLFIGEKRDLFVGEKWPTLYQKRDRILKSSVGEEG